MQRSAVMCKEAKDTALLTLKLAIALTVSRMILLLGPDGYDTYYNIQVARAMPEIIFAVLLVGGIGAVWFQTLYKRK
jgi:hypothetical protein